MADQSKNSTHILSFTVPSSVAAQIGETNQQQLFVSLNETSDETAVIFDAETRLLASAIFSKLMQKSI